MTVSLVAGVPLGALLGTLGSWRWTFAFVAVIAAACAAAVELYETHVAAEEVDHLAQIARLL